MYEYGGAEMCMIDWDGVIASEAWRVKRFALARRHRRELIRGAVVQAVLGLTCTVGLIWLMGSPDARATIPTVLIVTLGICAAGLLASTRARIRYVRVAIRLDRTCLAVGDRKLHWSAVKGYESEGMRVRRRVFLSGLATDGRFMCVTIDDRFEGYEEIREWVDEAQKRRRQVMLLAG